MTEWGVDVALTHRKKPSAFSGFGAVGRRAACDGCFQSAPHASRRLLFRLEQLATDYGRHTQRASCVFRPPAVNLVWALNVSLAQILAEEWTHASSAIAPLSAINRHHSPWGWRRFQPRRFAATQPRRRYPQGINVNELVSAMQKLRRDGPQAGYIRRFAPNTFASDTWGQQTAATLATLRCCGQFTAMRLSI
ncbi:MAG: hypothetical protein U0Y68_23695 [Blastocatellia bacterium]